MKKDKKKLLVDFLIISIVIFLVFFIYKTYKDYKEQLLINNMLSNVTINNYKDEILSLKEINKDIVGIVEIDNTEYKTFFVQGKDNKEYLRKNIFKNKDRNGTAFLDYRVNLDSKKIIIYGHNSRYVNMPFNFLDNYYDEDFYKNNKIINIITDSDIYRYEIISVFTETSDWSYQDIKFKDDEDFKKNIQKLIEKNIYKYYYNYSSEQILILQTCSTRKEYRGYTRKFLIVVARRVD